jgi:SPX domain protein involved in polyphosphate accumulation
VRLSLDEHMLLLRECAGGAGAAAAAAAAPSSTASGAAGWCRELEALAQLPRCDAVRFPYGILEIKLRDKAAAPEWVKELQVRVRACVCKHVCVCVHVFGGLTVRCRWD